MTDTPMTTDDRLDAILRELRRTNDLLAEMLTQTIEAKRIRGGWRTRGN